jgi:hypothetical protein
VFVAYNVSDECLREHGDVIAFALFLSSRFDDSSIQTLSYVASGLLDNYYDGIYSEQWVRDSLDDVEKLIGKLDNVRKEACTAEVLHEFISQQQQQ